MTKFLNNKTLKYFDYKTIVVENKHYKGFSFLIDLLISNLKHNHIKGFKVY